METSPVPNAPAAQCHAPVKVAQKRTFPFRQKSARRKLFVDEPDEIFAKNLQSYLVHWNESINIPTQYQHIIKDYQPLTLHDDELPIWVRDIIVENPDLTDLLIRARILYRDFVTNGVYSSISWLCERRDDIHSIVLDIRRIVATYVDGKNDGRKDGRN